MATDGPVFLVGPSRSGTALVRSMVNNDPSMHMAGETHYFDDLRPRLGGHSVLDDADAIRCEDYFLALTHRPYGHQGDPRSGSLDRQRLRDAAQQLGRTPDAYFEAYCRLIADEHGAVQWGEKTPRHVFRIAEILDTFPTARVVAMIRDPRAVIASYRDWRNQGGFDLEADPDLEAALEADTARARASYNLVMHSMLWRSTINAAISAREEHGQRRVYLQRYEDLVLAPERAGRELLEWLGLDFLPERLEVPVHNSSFSTFNRTGGVSQAGLERWRDKLDDSEVAVIQHVTKRTLRRCGYRLEPTTRGRAAVVHAYLGVVPAGVRAAVSNRERIAGLPSYVWGRVRFLLR